MSATATITTTSQAFNPNQGTGFIFDSTTSLSVNASAVSLGIEFVILEFDDTTPLKTVALYSLASGNNVLYTCPSGYTAAGLQVGQPAIVYGLAIGGVNYVNATGSSRNVYVCLVKSGESPIAPGVGSNSFLGAVALIGSGNALATNGCAGLVAGDSVQINTNAATATQWSWINILEVPL
jgi:hypothetical protein